MLATSWTPLHLAVMGEGIEATERKLVHTYIYAFLSLRRKSAAVGAPVAFALSVFHFNKVAFATIF